MYECRCNGRLQTKRFTRLAHTGLVVELENLKIKTRLILASQVYLQQNKKKAEAEGKNCHAKTMLSLEKPIKFI
jgi:hypothetical protein